MADPRCCIRRSCIFTMFYKPLRWMLRGLGHFPLCTFSDKYFAGFTLAVVSPAIVFQASPVSIFVDSMMAKLIGFASILYILASVGFIFHCYICRESYHSILTNLESISSELHTENTTIQATLFSAFTVVMVVNGFTFLLETGFSFKTVSRVVLHLAFCSPLLQQLAFADLLTTKFSELNIRLGNINTHVNTASLQSIITQINSVFRLHTHLHVVVWDINAHFCFYNLLSITAKLTSGVVQMYAYLTFISEGNAYSLLEHHVIMVSDVAFFVAHCLLCHASAKEANRTVMIAHHLLHPETPAQIWEEVGLFSRMSLKNKVSFSVGGIFSLDLPLIAKVAVASLSYLIIAVQLKDVQLSQCVRTK